MNESLALNSSSFIAADFNVAFARVAERVQALVCKTGDVSSNLIACFEIFISADAMQRPFNLSERRKP
jgi:hypothetical protein